LVEKLVRALKLLEGLVEENLDFVFKGGTSLMLLLEFTNSLLALLPTECKDILFSPE